MSRSASMKEMKLLACQLVCNDINASLTNISMLAYSYLNLAEKIERVETFLDCEAKQSGNIHKDFALETLEWMRSIGGDYEGL